MLFKLKEGFKVFILKAPSKRVYYFKQGETTSLQCDLDKDYILEHEFIEIYKPPIKKEVVELVTEQIVKANLDLDKLSKEITKKSKLETKKLEEKKKGKKRKKPKKKKEN